MDEQAPGLRDVSRMLLRHRLLIATVVGATTAAALVYSLTQPKAYTAKAQLLTRAPLNAVVIDAMGGRANSAKDIETKDISDLIAGGSAVAAYVQKAHFPKNTPEELSAAVKTRVLSETMIEVSATAPKPDQAKTLANGFAQAYLDWRTDAVKADLALVAGNITAQRDATVKQRDELQPKVVELNQKIAVLSPPGIVISAEQTAQKAAYIAQRDAAENQVDAYNAQIADADGDLRNLGLGTGSVNPGEISKSAVEPKKPSSPKPLMDGGIGMMVGLVAGVVAAYGRSHFDRRIRTRDDAARASGAAVLAAVPPVEWKGAPSADALVSISDPASAAAEQYRTLRANLAAQGLGSSIRCLLVTSPGKGEGKSSTVANLAVACANSGLKTLAVSADPRRPTIHAFFEVPDAPGLPEVLRGHAPLSAAIFMTAIPNLFVLPSRPDPATGSDLLASQRLQEVLAEATAHADIVLVDVTSIADGADSSILARLVGNCLLVVEADHTDRTAVTRAATTIAHAGARIVGTVLNRASSADETAGVPERSAEPAYNFPTNGHKLPEPPLVLTRPWGDTYATPKGLPSPRSQQTTWEGEAE